MGKLEYGELTVVPLVRTDRFSVSQVTLTGENRLCTNLVCDASYRIEKGWGYFIVEGRVIPVARGDTVVIPRGTRFRDSSPNGMVMVSEYVPPFDREQVFYLE